MRIARQWVSFLLLVLAVGWVPEARAQQPLSPLQAADAMRPCLWPEPYLRIQDMGQDTDVYFGRTMIFWLGYRWPSSADDFPRTMGTTEPPLVLSFWESPMSGTVVPYNPPEPFEARAAIVNCFLQSVPASH
jgi:hypothetical protein